MVLRLPRPSLRIAIQFHKGVNIFRISAEYYILERSSRSNGLSLQVISLVNSSVVSLSSLRKYIARFTFLSPTCKLLPYSDCIKIWGLKPSNKSQLQAEKIRVLITRQRLPQSGDKLLHLALLIEKQQYGMNRLNSNHYSSSNRIDIQDRVWCLQHEPWDNAWLEIEQLQQNLTAQFLLLQSLQIPLQWLKKLP